MSVKEIVAGLVVCVAGGSAWHFTHEKQPPKFETAPVEQGDIQSVVSATGTSSALITVDVGTQVSGIITELHADYDSEVKKGDLLAVIDPTPFQAKVDGAQAALNSAKASADSAKASVKAAESAITSARSDVGRYGALVSQIKSAEDHNKLELDRQKQLKDLTTADAIASAQTAFDSSLDDTASEVAQQQTAVVQVSERTAERDVAKNQADAADAQVAQAEANLRQAQVDLDHTRIVAPIDGIVLNREVSVGQTVAASAQVPVLFQLAQDLSKVEVDVNLDESDVSRVKAGQTATFNVDAYPGRTFDANVRQVRMDATNISNVITYDVVMDVIAPPVELFPGMTTNVRILAADHDNVIKIPNSALRFRPLEDKPAAATSRAALPAVPKGTAIVYVMDATGKPVARQVIPGITDGKFTEMVSGDLKAGDVVVVSETVTT
jgi:HlyD family secretion protein